MAFFKYLKKNYAEELVLYGRLRIGTIYEYRNYEDSERRDITEGTKNERTKIDEVTLYDNDYENWPRGLKSLFLPPEDLTKTSYVFKNLTILNPMNFPDAYIYCVTSNFSRKVMEDFNCDACVYIKDIQAFCDIISKKLVKLGLAHPSYPSNPTMHFRNCLYIGKDCGM